MRCATEVAPLSPLALRRAPRRGFHIRRVLTRIECGSGDLILDRNPFDPSSMDRNPQSDLILIALIYNLALAYHLYAMTENEEDPKYLSVVLKDALKLYQATEKRLCNLDSTSSFVIPALKDNMRHVVLSQSHHPDYC